jgi:creatinine amidohydrolase
MKEVRLFKLTRPEVEEYLKKNDVIIVPVGSNEQHGTHLALDTDIFAAFEISKRVAEKTGVLVGPPIPIGYSPHHMGFSGSITLTFDTCVKMYKEICFSLMHHGFNKIVIYNGHGGNRNPIAQALREIRTETGKIVYNTGALKSPNPFGSEAKAKYIETPGGHADEAETSVALYLGQRVLFEKGRKGELPPGTTDFFKKYVDSKKVVTAKDFTDDTVSGSHGDPTYATKEKGKGVVEALISELVTFIEDLKAS